MPEPTDILDIAFGRVSRDLDTPVIDDPEIVNKVSLVCCNTRNRSCVRVVLACALAKVHNPDVDIRNPHTEIGGPSSYSGRKYDETYISQFITDHKLPCNPTSGFLTPAFRNRNATLEIGLDIVGRPRQLYGTMLELLDYVYRGIVPAADLLAETIRGLLNLRNERKRLLDSMLAGLRSSEEGVPLSAEGIITLIEQHLKCPAASRLPVLVVAAAYQAAKEHLGEKFLPLESHTAADEQTGSLGDLEIVLIGDDNVVTAYEMKMRKVAVGDVDRALQKINDTGKRVDNYIFITTEIIDDNVAEYASTIYERTSGIEFVILDCIGFLRHFLHLFHRLRTKFLDEYQKLLLVEPGSSVRQELKEAFLGLRRAAESVENSFE